MKVRELILRSIVDAHSVDDNDLEWKNMKNENDLQVWTLRKLVEKIESFIEMMIDEMPRQDAENRAREILRMKKICFFHVQRWWRATNQSLFKKIHHVNECMLQYWKCSLNLFDNEIDVAF